MRFTAASLPILLCAVGAIGGGAACSSGPLGTSTGESGGGPGPVGSGGAGAVGGGGGSGGDPNDLGVYDLTGFAQFGVPGGTTGGGVLDEADPDYFKVTTADELVAALKSKTVKVIEIMNDLDLGWNEIPASAQTGALRQDAVPLLHPVLIRTGVSIVDVQAHTNLTIFSSNGATIRHAHVNIKRCTNIIVRNLKFDELWEWDEGSKGDYDKQGWDFITVDMATTGLWIDHCEFTKAYDGVVDIKGGSSGVTISWCKFSGDSGDTGSFVRQQIDALEAAGPTANPMYSFLRANGFSVDDIVGIVRSQKKGHLVGALELDDGNANLTVTLHHNWYDNMQDRMPRLRAGNAHAYNIYVSNSDARAARARRDEVVASMSPASAAKLQGDSPTYKFTVTLNGAISTEGGAVLLEASHLNDVLSPIRNNQIDAAMPAFTGKIKAVDTIYGLDGTVFRGGSEDPGGALSPVPAPVLPFSWNGFADLSYAYVPDDPASLAARLTAPDGAGAGRLTWERSNWMKTTY